MKHGDHYITSLCPNSCVLSSVCIPNTYVARIKRHVIVRLGYKVIYLLV